MPNMTTHRSFKEVLKDSLQDPETRAEWDRTQLARDVSIWLLQYRKKHRLTQTELAERLGWKQPVVARLESGEHEPSIGTLHHLVERLGAAARVEIDPQSVHLRFFKRPRRVRPTPDRRSVERVRTRESAALQSV
jgi:transcriptional regulator with XRE-family HTH domain